MGEHRGAVVYQVDLRDPMTDQPEKQRIVLDFLAAHGIAEGAFVLGDSIHVRRRDDGSLWLHTWRAAGNDMKNAPLCENCPACIKQEPVDVPLAAPVPFLASAYISPDHVLIVDANDQAPGGGWSTSDLLPVRLLDAYDNGGPLPPGLTKVRNDTGRAEPVLDSQRSD